MDYNLEEALSIINSKLDVLLEERKLPVDFIHDEDAAKMFNMTLGSYRVRIKPKLKKYGRGNRNTKRIDVENLWKKRHQLIKT